MKLQISILSELILTYCVFQGYDKNARPIQQTNGRIVNLYTPKDYVYVSWML